MLNSRVTTSLLQQPTSAAIRRAFISNSPSYSFSSLVRPGPLRFSTPSTSLIRHCSSDSHSSSSNPNLPKANPSSDKSTWRAMAEKDISRYLRQTHDRVFEHNRAWAAEKKKADPAFFANLSAGQTPEYLWIGCSDSRIPAEQITGLEPGDAFVHRNIANLVCNTDLNVMAVINYAVRHLKVKHIVVCGHYGCGGVKAAMTAKDLGILNPWLRNIRDVYRLHEKELDAIKDEESRYNRLVELNVIEQCKNVVKTAGVQQSYAENSFPIVHGWVFGFNDGLLRDLQIDFEGMLKDIQKIYNLTES
ncbi:carbonic anhydrase [Triangularia setosa]|uniref:Carbonic anhydrase n=1 Tax=Triangularia setosa TaxID=2587417 RepID=A0AAN6VYV1_9PEZI|nr:carbonic anhydrase [Podospora setosa]